MSKIVEEFEENELVSVAMQIILHAGDARLNAEKSLAHAKKFEFDKAREELAKAKENIRLAHVSQTNVIQNESRGISYSYSLLFTHAQDTLMTINSEVRIASELIDILDIIKNK
ncbi:MAG: PTS lactose/cellobiose transporter subunit IIA [Clostridium sp.]|uniref:Lichenan-specific phosphotransferase enzyme IIA component n=1 Tax=Clostridium tertium TaxID=1559 RepID=A0A6N3GJW7_9CLOT|nr:PTS lactose/cellobiose transporter subunit IIA [Clostridium sp.]MDU5109374.1 PTS lactose/cellobiose transporter subunit IIA [Clostridium sp.]